jgi:NADPH-dependent 2,4-dienoyl-CoA reductase/sulfur reductase-like enzyme
MWDGNLFRMPGYHRWNSASPDLPNSVRAGNDRGDESMKRTEVLVIGAGPAGIAAATVAAENGRKVLVLDNNLAAGGQIWRRATVEGNKSPHRENVPRLRAFERLKRSGAQVLTARSVFNAEASGTVHTVQETGSAMQSEQFHFEQLILATGARERFLPFPGWTLPGVFGAGGLQALVQGGYPVASKRVVVAGTGPLLLAVAAHLAQDGAVVPHVLEQAPWTELLPFTGSLATNPAKIMQAARYRAGLWKTAYSTGCWVVEAIAAPDGMKLEAVRITNGKRAWTEPCDLLACGYHLVPNTEIAELLGCNFRGRFVKVDDAQRTSLSNVFCVGEPTGIAGLEAALVQGEIAGLACAGKSVTTLRRSAAKQHGFGERLEKAFALRKELRSLVRPETIVCRCEDVAFADISKCTGWTDAKLQTRCGMGPCQGRVCGPAVEHLLGWTPISVRPPLFPVPLQALCSQSHDIESTKIMERIEENV